MGVFKIKKKVQKSERKFSIKKTLQSFYFSAKISKKFDGGGCWTIRGGGEFWTIVLIFNKWGNL